MPKPKGKSGRGSRFETPSECHASGAARYVPGWPPGWSGMPIGSLPVGLTRPESTPASAAPPSSPGMKAWITAAHRSANPPSEYGRPEMTTSTVGVPVARTASTSSACSPGSVRSTESHPSPDVSRPKSPARSPTASTATSAS